MAVQLLALCTKGRPPKVYADKALTARKKGHVNKAGRRDVLGRTPSVRISTAPRDGEYKLQRAWKITPRAFERYDALEAMPLPKDQSSFAHSTRLTEHIFRSYNRGTSSTVCNAAPGRSKGTVRDGQFRPPAKNAFVLRIRVTTAAPTAEVDEIRHQHILNTQQYFCRLLPSVGRLHSSPSVIRRRRTRDPTSSEYSSREPTGFPDNPAVVRDGII